MSVELEGADQLMRRIVDHQGRIDKDTRRVLARAGQRVRRRQRTLVPKKSGLLASAITYRARGTRWQRVVEVGPLIEKKNRQGRQTTLYGLFQEVGTARHKAQPFVKPSLEGEDRRLAADLNNMIPRTW